MVTVEAVVIIVRISVTTQYNNCSCCVSLKMQMNLKRREEKKLRIIKMHTRIDATVSLVFFGRFRLDDNDDDGDSDDKNNVDIRIRSVFCLRKKIHI